MSVRPAVIRQSLEAMRKRVAGVENPLQEVGASSTNNHRVAFRREGKLLEPIAGQFVMDFSTREKSSPARPFEDPIRIPARTKPPAGSPAASPSKKTPTPKPRPSPPTRACSISNPSMPPPTSTWARFYYNRQDFNLAEKHYRSALEADSRYALAYFDLGNVLDETGRVHEAIQTYKTALQLAPTYADAHYNLALAFEKLREPRKALKHWQAYVKLDTAGPWSVHARTQIQRILQADGLKLVYKRG